MRKMWAALVAMACMGAAAPAQAAEGLEWRFDAQPQLRYLLTAQVKLPEVMLFYAEQNVNLRVALFRVDVLTTCAQVDTSGKNVELSCDIDDVRIAAVPVRADANGKLVQVLDEYDGLLLDATVTLTMSEDGRVKAVGLDGIPLRNSRMVTIQENLRLVMVRAFSALDLQLPKKGDDGGKVWRQKAVLVANFPDDQGTMGSMSVKHVVNGDADGGVVIASQGSGLLGSGEMVQVGDKLQPKNMYNMTVEGTATFDTALGALTSRSVSVEGVPSTSTAAIDNIGAVPYVHMGELRLILPGQEVAPLPANQELGTEDAQPTDYVP